MRAPPPPHCRAPIAFESPRQLLTAVLWGAARNERLMLVAEGQRLAEADRQATGACLPAYFLAYIIRAAPSLFGGGSVRDAGAPNYGQLVSM